jgi:carbon-monoxide dehydrogenase medium subunit
MMGVAAVVSLDDAGVCRHAALAYCSAGDRPILADAASAALVGATIDDARIAAAAAAAQRAVAPTGSVHASADYQRHLAGVLTKRALRQALGRAKAAA